MSDTLLTLRLRGPCSLCDAAGRLCSRCVIEHEAADEIERLRAELKLRNETVDQLIKGCDDGANEVERCHTLIDALCEKVERAEKAKGGMDD